MTAADLLVGPRGRRFCLELLQQVLDDESGPGERLHEVLFWAGYHLARDRGDGVTLFGPGAADPAPAPSTVTVARALDDALVSVLPVHLEVRQVVRALADTAASAMSWQEPDATDVLLARTGITPVVQRLAEALADLPAVREVVDPPRDQRQWTTVFADDDGPHSDHDADADDAAARAIRGWRTEIDAERAAVRPRDRRRPARAAWSGSWWTTPPSGLVTTTPAPGTVGPLGLWAVEDDFGWERATVAPVEDAPGARVLVVDDADGWGALCRRWSLDVSGTTRRHDWFRTTGRDGDWVTPDWAGVAEEYDAVRLTVRGWLRAAGTAVPVHTDTDTDTDVGAETASVIAGWTPGTTVWLRDPQPTTGTGADWVFDDDDGGWHRA